MENPDRDQAPRVERWGNPDSDDALPPGWTSSRTDSRPPPPEAESPPTTRPFDWIAFPAVVILFAGVCVVVWLAMLPLGGSESSGVLIAFGAKVNSLIADGEYWRLLSAAFLHAGFMHLAVNMVSLLILGHLVEGFYGHARTAAICVAAAVWGNGLSYLFSPHMSVGASGVVFGLGGALAVFYLRNLREHQAGKGELINILLNLAINGVYGATNSGIDNWAHAGGLIAGVIAAVPLCPRLTPTTRSDGTEVLRLDGASLRAWVVLLPIVALPWLLLSRSDGAAVSPQDLLRTRPGDLTEADWPSVADAPKDYDGKPISLVGFVKAVRQLDAVGEKALDLNGVHIRLEGPAAEESGRQNTWGAELDLPESGGEQPAALIHIGAEKAPAVGSHVVVDGRVSALSERFAVVSVDGLAQLPPGAARALPPTPLPTGRPRSSSATSLEAPL